MPHVAACLASPSLFSWSTTWSILFVTHSLLSTQCSSVSSRCARTSSLCLTPSPRHLNSLWHTEGSPTSPQSEQMNVQNEGGLHTRRAVSQCSSPSQNVRPSLLFFSHLVVGAQASAAWGRVRGILRLVLSVMDGKRQRVPGSEVVPNPLPDQPLWGKKKKMPVR